MSAMSDLKRPSPQELAVLATSLGLQRDLVSDSDLVVAGALGRALRVWKLANDVIRQDEASPALSEHELKTMASAADSRLKWSDFEIARDVFGKNDSDAGDPNAKAPVTEDAIRKQLKKSFGPLGSAVFAWGKKHGLRLSAAQRFRLWQENLKEGKAAPGDYSANDFARWLGDEGSKDGDLHAQNIAAQLVAYVEKAENMIDERAD